MTRGAAILAATACGAFDTLLAAAASMAHAGGTIRADPARRAFHDAKYAVYLSLYDDWRRYRRMMTPRRYQVTDSARDMLHLEPPARTAAAARRHARGPAGHQRRPARIGQRAMLAGAAKVRSRNCSEVLRERFGVTPRRAHPVKADRGHGFISSQREGSDLFAAHRSRGAGDRAADRLAVLASPRRQPGAASRADPAAGQFRRHLAGPRRACCAWRER